MRDVCNTRILEQLVTTIKAADAREARAMFDDADFYARKLLEGLAITGRLLSGMSDSIDPDMDELRSLGDSIAVTAELVAGFSEVVEVYNWRCRTGEIREGRQHA
ncbi:hypothetical protein HKA43_002613 [Escherichia coli]|uniref:hypothetical protein n=1 Tax=Escherichia coli TaxID=562 RepID=UPI0007733652|nr:hypothetical protein [Escherichia coli]EIG1234735.1 hypothetical protein [Escherichia coli]EIG6123042.1 hypothetical protein [Escherichia coli]EJK1444843.1 hypothetical protein [Escherichia coli]EKK2905770.1 hypothetical protein [Escherichia coli]KXK84453.1 hypothetical protein AUS13_07155 [Escherichia coli]